MKSVLTLYVCLALAAQSPATFQITACRTHDRVK